MDDNYTLLYKKVDVMASATTRSIEDITSLNINYSNNLKVKDEKDDKVFEKV